VRAVSLTLNNFCQFRQQHVDFGPGLTAVIGPNGSGKSNMVGAMKYALTGDIPSEGNNDTNICQFADATETSYVSFEFRHAGTEATVIRYLRPSGCKAELHITGEAVIRGDRNVNPRIEALLGVDRKIIDDIVMVNQGDIFGFLSQKPSKRAEAFAKIFRTDFAEVCWKALGDHIRSRPVVQTAIDCEAVRTELANLESERQQLIAATAVGTSRQLRIGLSHAEEQIREWDARKGHQDRLAEVVQQLSDVNGTINQLNTHISENEGNVATLQEAADGCSAAAEEAKTALANLEHIAAINRRKEAIRTRISGLENWLQVDPPKEPDGYDADIPKQEHLVETMATTVAGHERFLESFDESKGLAECPTCHTSVDNLADHLAEVQRELPAERLNLKNLREILDRNRKHKAALEKHAAEIQRIEGQLQEARADLTDLETAPEAPKETPEQLNRKVSEHADYVSAISEYERVVADGRVQLGRLEGQVGQLREEKQRLERQIAAIEVSDADVATARTNAARIRTEIGPLEAAERGLDTNEAAIVAARQRLQDGSAAERANAAVNAWTTTLGPVRDLLHREAAPRFVSQRNLQRIQVAVNEHLERFDTDFRVRADEGLSFEARFNDSRRQPAERLSGGQKVVLALAFRLAVNFMYSDLGFLSLD
jgi:DNA repair exonuclease SbcCD ATPase subunit